MNPNAPDFQPGNQDYTANQSSGSSRTSLDPEAQTFIPQAQNTRATATDESREPAAWESGVLGPPDQPADGPTPAQQTQAARAQQAQAAAEEAEDAAAAEEEQMQEEERQQDLLTRRTTERGDALNAHTLKFTALQRNLDGAISRLAAGARDDPEMKKVYDLYQTQLKNAKIVSTADVRQWDIMTWIASALPDDLEQAVADIAAYHHEAAQLRWQLHAAEVREQHSEHADCPPEKICKQIDDIYASDSTTPSFGSLPDPSHNSFGDYIRDIQVMEDVYHVRASFEVRKEWLERAPTELRFGFAGLDESDFDSSLDGRMVKFLETTLELAKEEYVRAGVSVQARHDTGFSVPESDLVGGIRWKKIGKECDDLTEDLDRFLTSITSRKSMLEWLKKRLDSAAETFDTDGLFRDNQQAQKTLNDLDAYRTALADGVAIDVDDLDELEHDPTLHELDENVKKHLTSQASASAPPSSWGAFSINNPYLQPIPQNPYPAATATAGIPQQDLRSTSSESIGDGDEEQEQHADGSQESAEHDGEADQSGDDGAEEQDSENEVGVAGDVGNE